VYNIAFELVDGEDLGLFDRSHNRVFSVIILSPRENAMDRLEAMRIFVTTVEIGSFSAASRKLGIPLPTVSRKVSELEAHLNSRLLIRTTRKLSLTDAGSAYLASSKRILDEIAAAESLASGEYTAPRGELILTAPITFGRFHVLGIVNEFLKKYPDINVRMSLSDRAANLFEDNIEMAVRIGALPDSSMITTRVGSVRRVVVGSPEYFAKHGRPKQLSDLVDLTCVTFAALNGNSSWVFPGKGRSANLPVRPTCRLNINTAESAIDAAIAGIGVTHVISYQVAKPVAEGKLQVVLQEFEPEPMPVHLIHAAQGRLPLKMRSFLEFAAPRLRTSLEDDEVKLATKPAQGGMVKPSRSAAKEKLKKEKAAA
jgi:DNA-binding transcriptional LysR family regulator